MDAGILPVKPLARAKSRLAPEFDGAQRLEIARALLDDALALCLSVDLLRWWVVSEDDEVLAPARDAGLDTVPDPGGGLNGAIAAAAGAASEAGAESVTIIPCDVPLAYKGDLVDLLDTGATSDIVLVPSGDDGGTNALFLTPPDLIEPAFGTGSLQRHIALAERRGYRCSILALPRLALDIDTPADVDAFLAKAGSFGGRTAEVLRKLRAEQAP
ncbi:MAG TPA: 2-phospho-L-lactate guanylyltransferase [Actinomycetota bacterium]|nr:2-phospho-L-lactate guanylyltransferase [Actinomycetota bacterium]